jgi:16S rRNA (adenine1518-N6/adenine1519-N6)-dimethyltransferase
VVYQAFSQRRKALRNRFKGSLEDSDFDALQIDPNARAETLDIEAFVNMTHKLSGLRRV